jgi:hypothetical protein
MQLNMKKISDYIPTETPKMVVQGRVSSSIAHEVKRMLKVQGITWNEFLEACLKRYCDEVKGKKI